MTQVEFELPDDLKSALSQARLQYKAQDLKGVADIKHDGDFLSFVPKPAANESWAVGGQIVFADAQTGEEAYAGEVTEYNPDDGSVYIDVSEWRVPADLTPFKFRYKPFDYSSVLIGAFERLRHHPQLLTPSLAQACGAFNGLDEAAASPGQPTKQSSGMPQEDGIGRAWRMPWSILWGPPGTGKTQSVATALAAFAAAPPRGKVLVVTPTNIAADEVAFRLCSLLAEQGKLTKDGYCSVYRGGRGAGKRLSAKFPECLRDKAYAELYDSVKRKIADLEEAQELARHQREYKKAAEIRRQINGLRATLPDETEFAISRGRARVIILTTFKACTFVGDGDSPMLFEKVIVDEAGMVSRVTCAAVATLGKSVMLAGDPKQIGPIFASPPGLSRDVRKWLLASGLSHLTTPKASHSDRRVHFLDKQYRMHPEISAAVSAFTYDGSLRDSDQAKKLGAESVLSDTLPKRRAAYLIIDDIAAKIEDAYARKATAGVGYERSLSARVAMGLASAAAARAEGVLVVTPYRAQVRLLRSLAKDSSHRKKISIGTIHRHQGAERDVVIVDLVRAALSWNEAEISMLLNVALSRAKRHFILIASRAELATPVLGRLIPHLVQESVKLSILDEAGGQQTLNFRSKAAAESSGKKVSGPHPHAATLGEEIRDMGQRLPLFSSDQMRLFERNIGEGHYLVRGVAGSGKSLILANWAVRLLQRNPHYKVLVTFFNKGMHNLLRAMMHDACERLWVRTDLIDKGVEMSHVARVPPDGQYDAVFVDEAQDMSPEELIKLYGSCRKQKAVDGRKLRNLILFYDDSQNIYGRQTLEELKEKLPEEFGFTGRSFVLRETYRSTQSVLSFAINMALDPRKMFADGEPGLLQFMKVAELAKEGLLIRPEDSQDGLYHVRYTERLGFAPSVSISATALDVLEAMTAEIRRLIDVEGVLPGDIMVVTVKQPKRIEEALAKAGIEAVAYGGKGVGAGQNPMTMPARNAGHVRCTTVFSCKGHESPVVFFGNIQEIDTIQGFISGVSPQQLKKMKRCMLYVGTSRAMIRQYVFGTDCTLTRAAQEYSKAETPAPGLL